MKNTVVNGENNSFQLLSDNLVTPADEYKHGAEQGQQYHNRELD